MFRDLKRIANALERLAPRSNVKPPASGADAFVWHPRPAGFEAVHQVASIEPQLLRAIDRAKETLLRNTERFLEGLPANNALLWGARGMGKSSLIKAVHVALSAQHPGKLALVEIHREDIQDLPRLLGSLRPLERRFVVFCDDLSFEQEDLSYKSLKAALEGGIEGRPDNCLFYATSNRRHLLRRTIDENDNTIHSTETVQEKVSLSDRFGLWIGFHHCSQDEYLEMVTAYAKHYELNISPDELQQEALEWSMERGARSGRVAWQFIQDLAGRLGQRL
ncbi:MAG: ATP-binding protein [Hyphomicrobiales bacterium]|nr:ATP-binding protein [Hyphomicrobiales bacterium]